MYKPGEVFQPKAFPKMTYIDRSFDERIALMRKSCRRLWRIRGRWSSLPGRQNREIRIKFLQR